MKNLSLCFSLSQKGYMCVCVSTLYVPSYQFTLLINQCCSRSGHPPTAILNVFHRLEQSQRESASATIIYNLQF